MAAPAWILTDQGDVIDVPAIMFVDLVARSVVITLENGQTINYDYFDIPSAISAYSDYVAAFAPSPIIPNAPVLTYTNSTATFSWTAPSSGAPLLDYLLMWGSVSGVYTNSYSVSAGSLSVTAAAAGVDVSSKQYAVIVARNSTSAVSSDSNEVTNKVALIPLMTSTTTPSGTVSSSSTQAPNSADWNAFDHTNGWNATGGPTQWLQYQFAAGNIATEYFISSFGSGIPKTWTFEGSNDGVIWSTLDSQLNQLIGPGASYVFANSTAYSYYRWTITDTLNNAANTGMRLVQIYG